LSLLLAMMAACALPGAWAADPPATPPAAVKKAPPAQGGLDLAPPDIRRILPARELEGPLLDLDEPEEPPPTVQVHGQRQTAPVVPGGIASLWWGATHPTQAWRIFTPVQ
jgi:hypothetical protein